MSNEEKDPSRSPEAARESERILQDAFLRGDAGAVGAPRVSASVWSAGANDGPGEVVHEHRKWRRHVEEERGPGAGWLRRTLRRWLRR